MKIYRYLAIALGACLIFSMSGCRIVKAIGETAIDAGKMVGIGNAGKQEGAGETSGGGENNKPTIDGGSEEGSQLLVGVFVIVFILFLVTLGIKFFYFKKDD